MTMINLNAKDSIKCMRCETWSTLEKAINSGWNGDYTKGVLTGFCCPACQTPEEHIGAIVGETLSDYYADDQGYSYQKPKGVLSLDELVSDLFARTESVVLECARSMVTNQTDMPVADIAKAVDASLPDDYPAPADGDRLPIIMQMVEGIITGDAYKQDES